MNKRVHMHMETKSGSQDGFSLIELAMMMIIVGIISVPLMQRYQVYQYDEKKTSTENSMDDVTKALGEYYTEHGYYPCPADRSIAFGKAGSGISVPNCVSTLGLGSCSSKNGYCHGKGTSGSAMIGGIPYVTLEIPYTSTMDGYKNPITYAISDQYADDKRPFDSSRKATIYVDSSKATGAIITDAKYLLLSAGENGKGTFNPYGIQTPCTGATADTDNCDNNSDFVERLQSLGAGSGYYDDKVVYYNSSAQSLWALSQKTSGAMYSTNPGPIGIGTDTPDVTVKLDVAGDIKAEQVRASNYCEQGGANCMQTEVIAGNKTKCDEGYYLIGIANNKPVCKPMSVTVSPGNCPTGQFVTAIVGGAIQCAKP